MPRPVPPLPLRRRIRARSLGVLAGGGEGGRELEGVAVVEVGHAAAREEERAWEREVGSVVLAGEEHLKNPKGF